MPSPSPAKPVVPVKGNRQRSRTRAALLSAGQTLFATRSVDSVTIDEIVDAAEVAKGSFYNHFVGKDALADAIQELVQGDVEFHIFSANQDVLDPPARIARALCTVIGYAEEHRDRLQALLSLSARGTGASSPLNTGLSADIRHGLEQRRLSAVDLETGVLVVIGLTNVAVTHAMSPGAPPVGPLASAMGSAVLRALGMERDEAASIGRDASAAILEKQA